MNRTIPDWKRDRKRQCLTCLVCGEGSFLPKNRARLQDNHNVFAAGGTATVQGWELLQRLDRDLLSSEYLREMQIQWINSGNQVFGFTTKFVRA